MASLPNLIPTTAMFVNSFDLCKTLTGAGADSSHEVSDDGEGANAHAAEGRRRGDVAVQLLLQALGGVPVALHRRGTHLSRTHFGARFTL